MRWCTWLLCSHTPVHVMTAGLRAPRPHLVERGVGVLRRGQTQPVDLHKLELGQIACLAAGQRARGGAGRDKREQH